MKTLDEDIWQLGLSVAYHQSIYGKEVSNNLYPKCNVRVCFTPDPLYLTLSSNFLLMNRFNKRLRRLQMIKKVKDWFVKIFSDEEIVIPQIPVEDTAWINLTADNHPVRKLSKKTDEKNSKKPSGKKATAKKAAKKSTKKSAKR